ncbi:MAG: adenosylhomocysteinase [Micrococcales bacterium]|nr:adenosylhomocysteinase [Micrococcales bacterium]
MLRGRSAVEGRFEVADLGLAAAGRHQITLAEGEMPGLIALREEFASSQPLAGARITGSLHMTVQTAVLIETLLDLGAKVRWASCNIFSTQDDAAAAVVVGRGGSVEAPAGPPVFAWKGQSLVEYWDCQYRALDWPDSGPTGIVDDGGDATFLLLSGMEEELGESVTEASSEGAEAAIVREMVRRRAGQWGRIGASLRGVSEETTTGVLRLAQLAAAGRLRFPAINVNDSVTKSKFDNRYGIRHSLPDGLNRATDVLIGGKLVLIAGYGDVGKGAAEAMRGQGARVVISEIDPICALQAAMDGFEVARVEEVVARADFVITATGCRDVVTVEHMEAMRDGAVVGNIGHFDHEIDVAGLERVPGVRCVPVKDQVDEWIFPDGHRILLLSQGRLLNLGNATGHPSFVMSTSFANQVLAQIALHVGDEFDCGVHRLPKALDEKVARAHLDALGVRLTVLTPGQADYLGVPVDGPYKAEHYRY